MTINEPLIEVLGFLLYLLAFVLFNMLFYAITMVFGVLEFFLLGGGPK